MRNTVACLATVIGLVTVSGCRPAGMESKPAGHDSHAEMIEHIAKDHSIRIGVDTNADIVIQEASNTVTVVFTPGLVKRLPPDCLPVVHFDGAKKVFTEEQYEKFLDDFHDYLLLTYGEGHGPKP